MLHNLSAATLNTSPNVYSFGKASLCSHHAHCGGGDRQRLAEQYMLSHVPPSAFMR